LRDLHDVVFLELRCDTTDAEDSFDAVSDVVVGEDANAVIIAAGAPVHSLRVDESILTLARMDSRAITLGVGKDALLRQKESHA
jgi:hypothetical protein